MYVIPTRFPSLTGPCLRRLCSGSYDHGSHGSRLLKLTILVSGTNRMSRTRKTTLAKIEMPFILFISNSVQIMSTASAVSVFSTPVSSTPRIDYVAIALEEKRPLSIREFCQVTGYPLGYLGRFFHNLKDDLPIYVTPELIEFCGFGGASQWKRKEAFVKILHNFQCDNDFYALSNAEYVDFYQKTVSQLWETESQPQISFSAAEIEFPDPKQFQANGKGQTKHLILKTDCFKQVLMMLNTSKAAEVRQYYLSVDKLIRLYMEFQDRCKALEIRHLTEELRTSRIRMEEKFEAMENRMEELLDHTIKVEDSLGIAVKDRALPPANASKHECFKLFRMPSGKKPYYYVIRVQQHGVAGAVRRVYLRDKNAELLLEFNCTPNATYLFNRAKELLAQEVSFAWNCLTIREPSTFSEDDLIETFKKIEEDKASEGLPVSPPGSPPQQARSIPSGTVEALRVRAVEPQQLTEQQVAVQQPRQPHLPRLTHRPSPRPRPRQVRPLQPVVPVQPRSQSAAVQEAAQVARPTPTAQVAQPRPAYVQGPARPIRSGMQCRRRNVPVRTVAQLQVI